MWNVCIKSTEIKGVYQLMQILFINSCIAMTCFMIYGLFTESPTYVFVSPKEALETADRTKYLSSLCDETFNGTSKDNLEVIKNYPRGVADKYMWKIGGNMSSPTIKRQFPVFVTAIDQKYYPQSQGLFKSLHERFLFNPKYANDVYIIVFDLGMSKRQLNVLKKKCRCEIRRFQFEQFPDHVRQLTTYAFKPIIVQQVLMEFGFVWWMDSSVRFTTSNIDGAIQYAKNNNMLYTVSTSSRRSISLAMQTDVRTFQFLGEDACKFRPYGETWATMILFHYDDVTRDVVHAWTACALNRDCIAPVGTQNKIFCKMNDKSDGRCHRFDQSVFSIITRRLDHEQNVYPTDTRLNDIYKIERGDFVNYFESCRIQILCM